jgi:hypothetical protein
MLGPHSSPSRRFAVLFPPRGILLLEASRHHSLSLSFSPTIFRFNTPKDLRRPSKVSMAQTRSFPISLFFAGTVEVFTSFFFSFFYA